MKVFRKFLKHIQQSTCSPAAGGNANIHPLILCTDLDSLWRTDGEETVRIGDVEITLHLKNPHERRYAACLRAPLRYPQYDLDKFLIERFVRPGDTVLDAGANIGLTALHFLEKGARQVVAIEALPELAQRVRDLRDTRLSCIEAALSDHIGEVEFAVSQIHNQGSTYDKSVQERFAVIFGDKIISVKTPTVTIDSLQESKFDIWKLDIEGAEVDALRGAQRTLSRTPPRMIFAELFDDKVEVFQALTKTSLPFSYRAGILKKDYTLKFLPISQFLERFEEFHHTSPTYIFTQTALNQ